MHSFQAANFHLSSKCAIIVLVEAHPGVEGRRVVEAVAVVDFVVVVAVVVEAEEVMADSAVGVALKVEEEAASKVEEEVALKVVEEVAMTVEEEVAMTVEEEVAAVVSMVYHRISMGLHHMVVAQEWDVEAVPQEVVEDLQEGEAGDSGEKIIIL